MILRVRLLSAFETEVTQQASTASPTSGVRRGQLRIEFCNELEENSQGLRLRARVQRHFELSSLADCYRKAKQVKESGIGSDNITQAFIQDLLPGSDPAGKRSTGDYDNRSRSFI